MLAVAVLVDRSLTGVLDHNIFSDKSTDVMQNLHKLSTPFRFM